jgi:hypothetical protein
MNRPLYFVDTTGLSPASGSGIDANTWWHEHDTGAQHWYEKALYFGGFVFSSPPAFAECVVQSMAEESIKEGSHPLKRILAWTLGVGYSPFTGDNFPDTATVILPEFLGWPAAVSVFQGVFDLVWRLGEEEAW